VRFRRLEVRAYRAIDQAELEFGPGLNVLYGPNDLGKSTLAAAMRAVLLLPAESTAHQAFVPWHDVGPPKVRLTFERDQAVYRVTKVFGSGSLGSAQLESSPDGSSFHEEERGRAVDRRLRELLSWGIEPPGGKGAARGLPESFLSHVLLGAQSDVPLILERNLGTDRDASGRERLHEALSALSQDPVFKRVLEAAQAKVDAAFTPTGRRKTGQNSPFSQIKEQITLLGQEFERLTQQRRESEEVQQRILSLDEERLAIEAEIGTLEVCVDRDTELAERLAARGRAAERVAQAERALGARDTLRAELAELEAELATLRARAALEVDDVAAAEAALRLAEARAADAERSAAERMSEDARERMAVERAALQAEQDERRRECAGIEHLIALRHELAAAESAHAVELEALESAEGAEAARRKALAAIAEELAELRELATVLAWRAAEQAAARGRSALAEAETLDEQARALRERAARARAEAPVADVPRATLAELASLAREIEVTAARLDVGLDLTISVPPGTEVRLTADSAAERLLVAPERVLVERARSRISARLGGGIEVMATAGDAALRSELEALERRWQSTALPLFESHGVSNLSELGERIEAARERERTLADWLRAASDTEGRAREKRELGAELVLDEQRAAQHRQALERVDLAAREAQLKELAAEPSSAVSPAPGERPGARARNGPSKAPPPSPEPPPPATRNRGGLEALLARRQNEAEARRSRQESELPALAAARVRALTRTGGLDELRQSVRSRLAQAWAARGGAGNVPGARELEALLAAAQSASGEAGARLDAWERGRASELAGVQRQRDQAVRALTEARARHDAAQLAGRELRERVLRLEALFAERRLRVDPAAESAALRELEQARAALASYGALEEVSPDQLARSQDELVRAKAELERVLGELRRAEGALGHVGGDVVLMRERQTHEALERARAEELEREHEYEAYRLLVEQLREVENEQGVHLGRALEAPVSERFERLTEGRYRQVALDAGLGLQGVAVAGKARAYGELSEGTQEQLATILRLCIAEYLETALVLDDHLAQTHRQRAQWFRTTLREAAARIQIIVLTARPEDYLGPEELCNGAPTRDTAAVRVRAVDLERVIRRARYEPGPR
jgi:energy-coupling factor transporter ATP-binding protein EcfA2